MLLFGYSLMISYTIAMFGGHRHPGSGDIMALICHVIFQVHARLKGHVGLYGWDPLTVGHIPPTFGGDKYRGGGNAFSISSDLSRTRNQRVK